MNDEVIHRPLGERDQPLSSDVADALEQLVGPSVTLPRAFSRKQVVDELIEIAQIGKDGIYIHFPAGIRRAVFDLYDNRLTNSSVFLAGYKHYEKRTKHPVVPVTDFFFKNVYVDGTVKDVLDQMSEFEIGESLPKPPGRMRRNDQSRDFERDDEGGYLENGKVAGVVILPPNGRYDLLRIWLERRANMAVGQLTATVNALDNARPNTPAVQHLRATVAPVQSDMRKALPTPKRK